MRHSLRNNTVVSKNQTDTSILTHELQAFFWEVTVKRHIGCSGLHNGYRVDCHQFRAVYHHTDGLFGFNTHLLQMCSQSIGQFVEFTVGQVFVAEHDGCCIRSGGNLLADDVYERKTRIIFKYLALA